MPSPLKPREQGDLGELAAMTWLLSRGAAVYRSVFHSPDVDLIAVIGAQVIRVEVKTSACPGANGRWSVQISTRGGNQSWSGLVKHFDPERCDYLFVLVADGRQWFIPTAALDCRSGLKLGGPVLGVRDRARSAVARTGATRIRRRPGGVPERSNGAPCKGAGSAFAGSNPASPIPNAAEATPKVWLEPQQYERKLGRSCHANINQKRRVTIPQKPFFEAGLEPGDTVRVRCDGYGRVVLERAELPDWAGTRRAEQD